MISNFQVSGVLFSREALFENVVYQETARPLVARDSQWRRITASSQTILTPFKSRNLLPLIPYSKSLHCAIAYRKLEAPSLEGAYPFHQPCL